MVACFDGHDFGGYSEDSRVSDEGSGAEVSVSRQYNVVSIVRVEVGGEKTTYAEIPTDSSTLAVATMAAAVVKLKAYVQGATGCVPAPAIALCNVVTCVCSVLPIDFRSVNCAAVRPSAVKSESANLANPC